MTIKENVKRLLEELPAGVQVVAVAKARRPEEVREAVEAGVNIIGENYVQEAEQAHQLIGGRVKWHFIGHLQKNKVKKAVSLFDMIETVDSIELAREIDKRCREINKVMPVLIEINIARETQKSGILPEAAGSLLQEMTALPNVKVAGLMTVGPQPENPQNLRPYFAAAKALFEDLKKLRLPNIEMTFLSMGMSASYRMAIEEGANIVRIGTKIFEGGC